MKKLIFILMIFTSSKVLGASINYEKDSGSIIKIEHFESGIVKSKVIRIGSDYKLISYFETGAVEEIGYYNSEENKDGEWLRYFEDGTLAGVANYRDGIKHGEWKIYNPEGGLITYLKYKKGKRIETFMWTEDKGLVYQ